MADEDLSDLENDASGSSNDGGLDDLFDDEDLSGLENDASGSSNDGGLDAPLADEDLSGLEDDASGSSNDGGLDDLFDDEDLSGLEDDASGDSDGGLDDLFDDDDDLLDAENEISSEKSDIGFDELFDDSGKQNGSYENRDVASLLDDDDDDLGDWEISSKTPPEEDDFDSRLNQIGGMSQDVLESISEEEQELIDDNEGTPALEEDNSLTEDVQKSSKCENIDKEVLESKNMDSVQGKKNGIVLSLLLAFGITAGAVGGAYLPKYFGDYLPGISAEKSATQSELSALKEQVKSLNEKIKTTTKNQNEDINSFVAYKVENNSKQELIFSQIKESELSLKKTNATLEKYEADMLSRFEKVLKITNDSFEKVNAQSQTIKDTVLREALAIIEERNSDKDGKKLLVMQKQLQEAMNSVSQVEARQIAQGQLLSLVEDDVGYVKKSLAESKKNQYIPPLSKSGPGADEGTKEPEITIKGSESVEIFEPVKVSSSDLDLKTNEFVVAGVHAKHNGAYDIYIQPLKEAGLNTVEPFWFSPKGASSIIPGYGKIKEVRKLENSTRRVPYVIITEHGEIRGRR